MIHRGTRVNKLAELNKIDCRESCDCAVCTGGGELPDLLGPAVTCGENAFDVGMAVFTGLYVAA